MSVDVRAAAQQIIRSKGIEALTLAEIARSVRVTPAALYHHFEDLADIVRQTAGDIVTGLVGELNAASASQPTDNFALRMIEPSRAFRRWALAHRHEFSLLFGTPTAAVGHAHTEMTSEWVRRLAGVWGPVFVELWATQPYTILSDDELDPRLVRQMNGYRANTGVDLPPGALVVMLSCWRSIYGQVALEVFEHFAPLITDQEPMFERLMIDLVSGMGLADQYRPPTAS
ncbi:TetR/AcrR family transcriptional regulator [Streptomyces bluensis]|uniref:TetR/AcrR family transcriptional regulator n=1 Tax=Streptomyces bluensis TaxID=33897 RepID=A0ABW6UAI0_9ACTN